MIMLNKKISLSLTLSLPTHKCYIIVRSMVNVKRLNYYTVYVNYANYATLVD